MVEQIKNCITWATENIEKYGGDKDQIYICAISTGAHLVNLALLSELETYLQSIYFFIIILIFHLATFFFFFFFF